FQAEDGIRDFHVTGVQTCALPICQQAGTAPPGANGLIFLPYMAGERTPLWSSVARGVFFGLSYNTTRADILRAIMEGCAFAVYRSEERRVGKEWRARCAADD